MVRIASFYLVHRKISPATFTEKTSCFEKPHIALLPDSPTRRDHVLPSKKKLFPPIEANRACSDGPHNEIWYSQ